MAKPYTVQYDSGGKRAELAAGDVKRNPKRQPLSELGRTFPQLAAHPRCWRTRPYTWETERCVSEVSVHLEDVTADVCVLVLRYVAFEEIRLGT